ncbi:hypothetical protein PIB30_080118 [Stylosanthes scabra]|uniref:Uncharacterized protein n=1 Tax=Stylosanthes scabra TaxID=79078 RepID=A0ABU6QTT7_9FABA|nr:hypothetical protein [Stylosanthes scabra]
MSQGKFSDGSQKNPSRTQRKRESKSTTNPESPRLAALRAPQSPPLKMRTRPSRASPRLAALKDSLLPNSSGKMDKGSFQSKKQSFGAEIPSLGVAPKV